MPSFLDPPDNQPERRPYSDIISNAIGETRGRVQSRFERSTEGLNVDREARLSLAERIANSRTRLDQRQNTAVGSTAIAGNPFSYDISPVVNGAIKLALAHGNARLGESINKGTAQLQGMEEDRADYRQAKATRDSAEQALDQVGLQAGINRINTLDERDYKAQVTEDLTRRTNEEWDRRTAIDHQNSMARIGESARLGGSNRSSQPRSPEKFFAEQYDVLRRNATAAQRSLGTRVDGAMLTYEGRQELERQVDKYNAIERLVQENLKTTDNADLAIQRAFETYEARQAGAGSASHLLLDPDNREN